jgi:hypothetical protein
LHSDSPKADLQKMFVKKIKWVQECIDPWRSIPTPFISAKQLSECTVTQLDKKKTATGRQHPRS